MTKEECFEYSEQYIRVELKDDILIYGKFDGIISKYDSELEDDELVVQISNRAVQTMFLSDILKITVVDKTVVCLNNKIKQSDIL